MATVKNSVRDNSHQKVTIEGMRGLCAVLCAVLLLAMAGCVRKEAAADTPPAPGSARNDSYVDLQPGWTVRVILPLFKSGAASRRVLAQEASGTTMSISISAPDVVGYTTARYVVTGKKGSSIRLIFVSAEETRDGKTVSLAQGPALPFELPRKSEHVRLIYLVRVSEADHNMAIAGAKHIDALQAFTDRLRQNPRICPSSGEVFCSWVPVGIAVRPENP